MLRQRSFLTAGLLAEVSIVVVAAWQYQRVDEAFRHAARWSGRLSLLFFLLAVGAFTIQMRNAPLMSTKKMVEVFCILHVIHLGLVVGNVWTNAIPLVPMKLAGGALAYGMILIYPFVFDRITKRWMHLVYFYYVGVVMGVTILSRMRGNFQGAEPSLLHYLGMAALVVLLAWMSVSAFRKRYAVRSERLRD